DLRRHAGLLADAEQATGERVDDDQRVARRDDPVRGELPRLEGDSRERQGRDVRGLRTRALATERDHVEPRVERIGDVDRVARHDYALEERARRERVLAEEVSARCVVDTDGARRTTSDPQAV